jgi:hypothetical protein
MKALLASSLLSVTLLSACETIETADRAPSDTLAAKRVAAVQRQQQEAAQMSESQRNLMDAQQNILNRDGNSTRISY